VRILILSSHVEEDFFVNFVNVIESLPLKIIIDKITTQEESVKLCMEYIYDVIFVDTTTYEGKEFIKFILNNHPKQRVITMFNNQNEKFEYDRMYHEEKLYVPTLRRDLVKILTEEIVINRNMESSLLREL